MNNNALIIDFVKYLVFQRGNWLSSMRKETMKLNDPKRGGKLFVKNCATLF